MFVLLTAIIIKVIRVVILLYIVSVKKMMRFYLGMIVLFFIFLAGLSLKMSSDARDNFSDTVSLHTRVNLVQQAQYKLRTVRGELASLTMAAMTNQPIDPARVNAIRNHNKEVRSIVEQWIREPKTSTYNQELSERAGAVFVKLLDNYMRSLDNLHQSAQIINESDALMHQLEGLNQEYLKISADLISSYENKTELLHRALIVSLVIISGLFILLYLSLFRYITRNVLDRLAEASTIFSEISKGQLAKKVPQYGSNEIGKLFVNIELMRKSLAEIISGVKEAATNIKNNSVEIAEGNNDLSSRTEEQASALQETAASMEQIKTTVENNTTHAHEANKLAMDTKDMADSGSLIMVDVVHSMDTIANHASQISNIIKVIDGIAGQTNILALNAAVEAARAGEQGRGFAVVATEVRNLAQRSADAAKEIRGLIEHSVHDTQTGSKRVDSAKNTMTEIVAMVSKVSGIMQDITQASEEQSMGIRQVAVAINEMDVVTQQNSALVEESATITALMNEQTMVMEEMVSVFQLNEAELSR
ncbi:methyl-accepting chemotaxis protein [Yersinia bercovieri]|uniref:methyl-accepting chemotaxis protein n=1 Tax=Yersinia bercovieri TaxID=634 RepID=UPI0005E944B7|nr:methyl-accepting chemotaxis protein [Yersinia bercovieri]MDN0101571.1 methyl-accepting chemotaxis protein [Yersinia bercovieri]CNI83642.1 putative methyl-accepting chemotaxis protein [Yersinia bercovieri]